MKMAEFCENPTEPLRLQKATDFRIPPHLHTSAEILYIEKGGASLTLGSLDYKLHTGDFVLIMPSMLHSVTPDEEGCSLYVIDCKCDIIPEIIKRYSGLRPASPVLRAHDVPKHLLYALVAFAEERDRNIAYSWINLVFTLVSSNLRFAEIHDGITSDLSNRILAYLSIHYRDQISLDDLATAMGISRFHLSHLFSNKLGIGFKEYLNNLRVEYAKGLLRSTDTPISEIYASSGFENQRTFNRVFRENTGTSPRDYRLGRENFGVPDPKKVVIDTGDNEYIAPVMENAELADDLVEVPIEIEEPAEPKKKPSGKRSKKTVAAREALVPGDNADISEEITSLPGIGETPVAFVSDDTRKVPAHGEEDPDTPEVPVTPEATEVAHTGDEDSSESVDDKKTEEAPARSKRNLAWFF